MRLVEKNQRNYLLPEWHFKDVVAGSSTQAIFFTMNLFQLSFAADEFLFFFVGFLFLVFRGFLFGVF